MRAMPDQILQCHLREIYGLQLRLEGSCSEKTFDAALTLSKLLMEQHHYHEAKGFLFGVIADARKKMFIEEAPESVPTTDILVRLSKINFNYAICLWKYHFYGYDSYRDDLRNSIEILEKYDTYPDGTRPAGVDEALIRIRSMQLDWCIHDLTPATFEAYRDS